MNLRELFNESADEDISDVGGGFWEPEDGQKFRARAIMIRGGATKKGMPRWNIGFKVIDGPDEDKLFWQGFNLSSNKKFNAVAFHHLDLVGLDIGTLEKELGDDMLSSIVDNARVILDVEISYRPIKGDPKATGWADHTYTLAEGSSSGTVELPDDDDDGYE